MYNPRRRRSTAEYPLAPPPIPVTTWRDLLLEQRGIVVEQDPSDDDSLDDPVYMATDVQHLLRYVSSVIRHVRSSLFESTPMVAWMDSTGNQYHRTPRESIDDCRLWLCQFGHAYPERVRQYTQTLIGYFEQALYTDTADEFDEVLASIPSFTQYM